MADIGYGTGRSALPARGFSDGHPFGKPIATTRNRADVDAAKTIGWPKRGRPGNETFGKKFRLYGCGDRTLLKTTNKKKNSGSEGDGKMTQTELNKYKAMLEAKQ